LWSENKKEKLEKVNNYRNSFTEVYVILEHLEEMEYKKIPNKVIDAIFKNRNTQYFYKLEDDVELRKQRLYEINVFKI
jgi:hypothetical protein